MPDDHKELLRKLEEERDRALAEARHERDQAIARARAEAESRFKQLEQERRETRERESRLRAELSDEEYARQLEMARQVEEQVIAEQMRRAGHQVYEAPAGTDEPGGADLPDVVFEETGPPESVVDCPAGQGPPVTEGAYEDKSDPANPLVKDEAPQPGGPEDPAGGTPVAAGDLNEPEPLSAEELTRIEKRREKKIVIICAIGFLLAVAVLILSLLSGLGA